jgi:signal transduction histidine kinase
MENSVDRWHWMESCISIIRVNIAKGDLKTAREYLNHAEKEVDGINSKDFHAAVYELKYKYLRQIGDFRNALDNYILSRQYADSTLNLENVNHINNLRIRYETEKRELLIESKNAVISRQNIHRRALMAGVAVCIVFLILLWYMLQLRTRRNRALAETNATKDKFFSIISHDLKSPVNAQRDALQLLAENAGEWDAAFLSDYAKKLLKSADGQVVLLNNLLNWAQMQTGRMPYIPVRFELIEAIQPDTSIIKSIAERKGIAFETNLPAEAAVVGDDKMLCTVIRNLLSNAIKFTPEGGTVTLDISPTSPISHTISVVDTGTGMTDEQIQNLYNIDRRYSQRGTSGEQGSGLGLIVCKELLEKHGSTLNIESEEGKGSRFWFEV